MRSRDMGRTGGRSVIDLFGAGVCIGPSRAGAGTGRQRRATGQALRFRPILTRPPGRPTCRRRPRGMRGTCARKARGSAAACGDRRGRPRRPALASVPRPRARAGRGRGGRGAAAGGGMRRPGCSSGAPEPPNARAAAPAVMSGPRASSWGATSCPCAPPYRSTLSCRRRGRTFARRACCNSSCLRRSSRAWPLPGGAT